MTRILDDHHASQGFATRAVHAGPVLDPLSNAVMPPIYQTSTYAQSGLGRHKGFEYGRTQNPTREALERAVASLELGTHGFAFGSGLAALDAILKLFSAGDHIVSVAQLYGGYLLPGSRVGKPGGIGLVVSHWNTRRGWPYRVMQFRTTLRDTTTASVQV
mgnify:CR=1 FL=1